MSRLFLIPAAGEGRRFQEKNIIVPKPLIKIKGITLLEHTLTSFKFKSQDRLVITVQKKHSVKENLNSLLNNRYKEVLVHWIELDNLLPGQLATSMEAIKYLKVIDNDATKLPLYIHNCDTWFDWTDDLEPIKSFATMPVFEAQGTHWSFGKPDPKNPEWAIEIAEKQRISKYASIGLYGFANGNLFFEAGCRQITSRKTINGEYYVAPLLQRAIEEGEQVSIPLIKKLQTYGTPEEACRTFAISLDQMRDENNDFE